MENELTSRGVNNDLIISFRKDTSDEDVIAHSFSEDIFFRRAPQIFQKQINLCIDIGAHIGTFSINLAHSKNSKVLSFEPSLETFKILEKNVNQNSLGGYIKVFNKALSSKKGVLKLYHDMEGNWGHSITSELSNSYEEVEVDTLNSVFEDQNIEQCDLIKFNCEGAEFDIVYSISKENYKKIKSMIILYHQDLSSHSSDEKSISNLLKFVRSKGFFATLSHESHRGQRGWLIAEKKPLMVRYYLYCKIVLSKFLK